MSTFEAGIPVGVLRQVVNELDDLAPPTRAVLLRLADHYDPEAAFPESPPASTGFGPLDTDNSREYHKARRQWVAGNRPDFKV